VNAGVVVADCVEVLEGVGERIIVAVLAGMNVTIAVFFANGVNVDMGIAGNDEFSTGCEHADNETRMIKPNMRNSNESFGLDMNLFYLINIFR
jgi:hypothetical protein